VVRIGSLLWGMRKLVTSWVYIAGGNRAVRETATCRGMAVVGVDCLILFIADRQVR
jgi:hypothetical protein